MTDKSVIGNYPFYDVAIVGAGPVGLSLGIDLASKGVKVVVLEKNSGTSAHSRAPAIWPRTQEVLAGLGVIDRFLEEGIRLPALEIHDVDKDRTIFRAPISELKDRTKFAQLLILPQSQTEKLLLEHLRTFPSADIRFSTEFIDLNQSENSVILSCSDATGHTRLSAKIVVGADGAHSAVREKINASFPGETYPLKAALADVELPGKTEGNTARITNRNGFVVGIRIRENRWRLIMPMRREEDPDLENRIKRNVEILFGRNEYDLIWKSEFRLHKRLSSTFADRRAVLAGDAAHLNSPVGGQGMNAGIQDIELLGDSVVKALKSDHLQPLEHYARLRKKQIERGVNDFTDTLTHLILFSGNGRFVKPVMRLANFAMRFRPVRRRILMRLAMLNA